MAIGIKAPKLIASEPQVFNSTHVKGLRLINQSFSPSNGIRPSIDINRIEEGNNLNAECIIKNFADGARFEVYRMKDAVLKFVKNKYGEIQAFKYRGVGEKENVPCENIIENTKLAFAAKIRNFFD